MISVMSCDTQNLVTHDVNDTEWYTYLPVSSWAGYSVGYQPGNNYENLKKIKWIHWSKSVYFNYSSAAIT